ncbi:MAG: nucleotidyltransferase domain-containing protein [Candidatus Aenigmarchaeota archaeon]|nr:nucleotidyltransferase domain-containing protein [Candidatus Aenigmarchaeota archaeon]
MSNITQKWVNVLLPFTGNYGSKLSGTELAMLSKTPQQTASRHLNALVKQSLLDYEKQGRNKLYHFDHSKHSTKTIYEILENHKGISFQQKLKEVFAIINEMLGHAESLIIFGSYSAYSFDKSSDLDIVVIGKYNKREIKKMKQRQTIQINEHYVSYEDFGKLIKSKNPLAIEILKSHIIFGNVSKIVDIFLEATS